MSGSRDMSTPTKVAGFVEDVPYSAGEMETECRFTSVGHKPEFCQLFFLV